MTAANVAASESSAPVVAAPGSRLAQISVRDRARGGTRARVYATLREAIVGGEFVPGQRLSEVELATLLGVSRTPVREALVRLRDDRLVEVVPQLGTYVTRIGIRAVNDAQFVREALECAAIRLAAEQATAEDVAALRAILRRQEEVRDADDRDRFSVLDDELHAALCDVSGNGLAWGIGQRANSHLRRVRRLSLPQPNYLREMVEQHVEIVDTVARHDPDAAEATLRHHLRSVLGALPALLEAHPDYFDEG